MDHADVLVQLELAAVEPGGLDRLMAGDTAEAAAVAAHLAGCDACTAELLRIRRQSAIVRDAIRTQPPADLRDRTLAFVRAVGRDRTVGVASAPVAASAPMAATPSRAPGIAAAPVIPFRQRLARIPGWASAVAAVLALAVAGTSLVVALQKDSALRDAQAAVQEQADITAALAKVSSWTVRVTSEPDARTVRLASATGGDSAATLVFSPTTREIVVVADQLSAPASGQEFRCWVEVDGTRRPVGKMYFGAGLAYWVGIAASLANVPSGSTFGISLADAAAPTTTTPPVLSGRL